MSKRPLNLDDIRQETKQLRHPPLPPTDLHSLPLWEQYIKTLTHHLAQSEYMSHWEQERWKMALEDAKRMQKTIEILQKPLPDPHNSDKIDLKTAETKMTDLE